MKRDMLWHLFNVQMFIVWNNAAKQIFCFECVRIYEVHKQKNIDFYYENFRSKKLSQHLHLGN